jgi:hypothetical protein
MNTSALKSFAPAVRRQLMEAVSRKLDVVLAAQTPDYRTTYARQVDALRRRAAADRQALVERVAYTWFNRLAALRYLDRHGWHPFRARVLTPATPDDTQPELLKEFRAGTLAEELARHADAGRLNDLLDGRIPSADAQGEVYRHLVLAACRFYHSLLPDLFERLDDETELLLPDDLLTAQSVAEGFRTQISDEDCAEVEVLGWLYQFYIAEKKDTVMARKSAVPTEDIPAVTQLFTPHWIVRYLVENSLGRLWLLNRPGSGLRAQMPYYIEGEPETDFLRIASPEEIRVIDPAVGSGHMLTYAFDLLFAIYEEEGYAPSDIPALILKHNLYGVDIDPRAAQLASLALVLKARERSRRFFQPGQQVQPNVIALQDVRFTDAELREYVRALDLGALFSQPVYDLLRQFEDATTFGSLIQPVLGERDIQQLRAQIEAKELGGELFLSGTHQKVLTVLEQAEYLTQRHHVAVANPPYMGSLQLTPVLGRYVARHYPRGSQDLYGAFVLRNIALVVPHSTVAMITFQNWLSASSFQQFREYLIERCSILSMVHNGRGVWGADFGSCAFVLTTEADRVGKYFRLFTTISHVATNEELEARFSLTRHSPVASIRMSEFARVPGCAIVYWASPQVRALFSEAASLGSVVEFKAGLSTGNNPKFQRNWFEISQGNFAHPDLKVLQTGRMRWFPCNSGGEFRKWYGNNEIVVDWGSRGGRIKASPGSAVRNEGYYFRPALTYNKISIGRFAARYRGVGFTFDDTGRCAFPVDESVDLLAVLGFLCSAVADHFLRMLTPTVSFTSKELSAVPWRQVAVESINALSREGVAIAREDWDNYETSWDFSEFPLVRGDSERLSIADRWDAWESRLLASIGRMRSIEEQNNRLWIEIYDLQGEVSPEVPEEQITLARPDRRRDMAAFLSYAVGCMMGRYSLDAPGLILANAGDTVQNYLAKVGKPLDQLTFAPDEDGIVPVLDGEWFEDDVVARTRDFLRATFGEETLRENLRFIEESLGKDVRKYFLTDFYKDHLQTYKKRPIYWMVQSPRKGFSVLVYLHRYTRDTLNKVLNRYLREYQAKLRDRLEHLARAQADPGVSARDKTAARKEADRLTRVLHECEEWERQTLLPLAQQRIELDLDDGVKVNYLKLGEALAPIPGLAAKDED